MLRPLSLVLVAAALSLCSCENTLHRFAGASPAPGTVVKWPGMPFDEVRAFCYDYTTEASPSFFVNGRMHKGVMNPQGKKLTAAQTQTLLKLITTSQPKGPRTPCYAPHHAFVFYNKGKVVAWFEMCFGCNQQRAHPGGTPEYIDRKALWDFTGGELGLPVGAGNKFYTQACSLGAPR